MRTILLAAVAASAMALPALAGEGNGDPFVNYNSGTTTAMVSQRADVGSDPYPDVAGRPGSVPDLYTGDIVPMTGSQQPVQTANSLPRGFERGVPAYSQHLSIRSSVAASNSIYLPRS